MSIPKSPLTTACYGLAEHTFRRHSVIPPANYTTADLESPITWAHLRTKFKMHDEIRAIAEDGSWIANLLVVAADNGVVRVKELFRLPIDLGAVAKAEQHRYVVQQRGSQGWCVVDTEENRVIRQGCKAKSDAEKQLEDHLLALSR
jgi:hypothetical protein